VRDACIMYNVYLFIFITNIKWQKASIKSQEPVLCQLYVKY